MSIDFEFLQYWHWYADKNAKEISILLFRLENFLLNSSFFTPEQSHFKSPPSWFNYLYLWYRNFTTIASFADLLIHNISRGMGDDIISSHDRVVFSYWF